jgi:hypothetical protein
MASQGAAVNATNEDRKRMILEGATVARRTVLLSLSMVVCVAIVLVGPAEAQKRKHVSRFVTSIYDAPAVSVQPAFVAANCGSPNTGCLTTQVATGERFVSIKVRDSSGLDAYADVYVNASGVPVGHAPIASFCGQTTESIPVQSGDVISVVVSFAGVDAAQPCAGAATSGRVTAMFSRTR